MGIRFGSAREFLLTTLSGVGCGLSAATPHVAERLEPLAWVAIVPFFAVLASGRVGRGILFSYAVGLAYVAAGLFWLGRLSWVAVGIAALYYAIYFLGFALAPWLRVRAPGLPLWAFTPLLWAFAESLTSTLSLYPTSWLSYGYTQAQILPLVQIAEWTGVAGVTILVVGVNAAIADMLLLLIRQRTLPAEERPGRPGWKATLAGLLAAPSALLIAGAWGHHRIGEVQSSLTQGPRVLLVQGNIPSLDKHAHDTAWTILWKHVRVTTRGLRPGIDLVVWPETAILFRPEESGDPREVTGLVVQRIGVPLLAGAYGINPGDPEGRDSNSAFLFGSRGEIAGRYDKQVLVPFGEYVPLLGPFPPLRKKAEDFISRSFSFSAAFLPGPGPTLFPLEFRGHPLHFATLICYEDVLAGLTRAFAREGADFFLVISNEDWYWPREMSQHLDMAVFRAVETRRPFLRATNTGITCAIDPTGRIAGRLEESGRNHRIEGSLESVVSLALSAPSCASAFAPLFPWVCALALVFVALVAVRTAS